MKPTLAKIPSVGNWSDVSHRIGRDVTDRQKEEITCVWAGQLGHEKCGWCKLCNMPRSMEGKLDSKGKKCEHPMANLWRPT